MTRLREVLGDSAESPQFIETLPRRGYRFIASIEPNGLAIPETPREEESVEVPSVAPKSGRAGALLRRLAVGAALALLILAALYTDSYFHRHSPAVSVVPFTSLPGPGSRSSIFSRWYAYYSPGTESRVEVGSEQLLRLTNNPAEWITPAWSADGRFVAFTREAGGASGVFLIPALGGAQRKLRSLPYSPAECNSLSWSPDGRYLAHPQVPEKSDRYQMALLDMQDMQPVATQRWPSCVISDFPAFARTGHKLAFACTPSWGLVDLYVIPEIGQDATRVTRLLGFPFGMTWSRDEKAGNFAWRG